MRHTVTLHGVIIGHSELEHVEPDLGRAWGALRPGLGWELVQPVFQLFVQVVPVRGGEPHDTERLERYHAARDKLGLQLVDAAGTEIATSAIHIADYPGHLELDVLITDDGWWAGRGG